jgi:hypothetical protein
MDTLFEGRRWLLAPEAIDYIARVLNMSAAQACGRLQQEMRDTNIRSRDPLRDGAPIDSEFWRWAPITPDGRAFNLRLGKGLDCFEVCAEDLLKRFPPLPVEVTAGPPARTGPEKTRRSRLDEKRPQIKEAVRALWVRDGKLRLPATSWADRQGRVEEYLSRPERVWCTKKTLERAIKEVEQELSHPAS